LHSVQFFERLWHILRAKIAKPHRFGSKKSKAAFPTVGNLLVGPAQELTDSGINPPYA
jgi:hypothetical protein